ncbi:MULTISPECIES: LysE family translocator [Streptomyces]|uniref:LysE family translocator n=1 Tax=Streptomyces TaxID=1883 RepID=UPI00163C60E2|nr:MULTISPECIES: LysE family translocator [Streptomyces]MBC2879223.1 LysE family translocator [Streptomyces sp. TYQ1024]UBI39805.1 LysE family translocator [Streptomyces mobaraensis]UKW32386.1 LysE family translocator [Streptomyces sp. TYQ1024]
MWTQTATAAGVLALLTVVPGPDMAVVTKRAVAAGRAEGLRTAAGITVGLLAWGVFTVVGLAAVLAASAEAYLAVKLLGAGYLAFLGFQALWQSRRGAPAPTAEAAPRKSRGAFVSGLISNLLNPKIAVFYTGVLPTLAPDGLSPTAGMSLLVLLHAVLTLSWLGTYVYVVSRARSVFERPRVRRALDRVTGVVLLGFGLRIAAETG